MLEEMLCVGVGESSRCLLLGAAKSRGVIQAGLRRAGAVVDEVAVYRTKPIDTNRLAIQNTLQNPRKGYVTFASGSAAESFMNQIDIEDLKGWKVACIGPVTASAIHRYKIAVDIMPKRASVGLLIMAIFNDLGS